MNYTAFSYSRLTNFEQCPKKFYALSIAKSFKENESEQMLYGSQVHKALERRIAANAPLPNYLGYLEPTMGQLAMAAGQKFVEFQMAVDYDWNPCEWFAKKTYCRAIADLAIDFGKKALLFDYKTGNKSEDTTQLCLTGDVFFHHRPELEEIRLAFIWTKDQTTTQVHITRDGMADRWSELAPRVERYQHAFERHEFPPRAGRHCRYCPVSSCPNFVGKAA